MTTGHDAITKEYPIAFASMAASLSVLSHRPEYTDLETFGRHHGQITRITFDAAPCAAFHRFWNSGSWDLSFLTSAKLFGLAFLGLVNVSFTSVPTTRRAFARLLIILLVALHHLSLRDSKLTTPIPFDDIRALPLRRS